MSDDKSKKDFRDRSRISLSEKYEVQYWTQKFNVSEQELEQVIKRTGSNDAKKIEEAIRKK